MTEEERQNILLGVVPGPVYTDRCGHGGYVATFECAVYRKDNYIKDGVYDLYVFDNGARQEVCLRYGEDDCKYESPGSVTNVIENQHMMEEYRRAVAILKAKGKIRWISN